MKFKKSELRERKQQFFDKDNITITMAGKTFNVYDKIQEGREDTELYPTLEKYGCIPTEMTKEQTIDFFKNNMSAVNGKIDLRNVQEAQIQSENLFYQLPLEIRKHFNNSIQEFQKNGYKYMNEKVKEWEAKQQKPVEQTTQTEATNNE